MSHQAESVLDRYDLNRMPVHPSARPPLLAIWLSRIKHLGPSSSGGCAGKRPLPEVPRRQGSSFLTEPLNDKPRNRCALADLPIHSCVEQAPFSTGECHVLQGFR